MSVKKEYFGKDQTGTEYSLYTIDNGRMHFSVTDLGACLVRVMVPDAEGKKYDDVVLGYDSAEEYLSNPDFYGALVGPSANRVKEGLVCIDGVTLHMDLNDNTNNLHTDHADGLHKRKWQAEIFENENRVTFTIGISDGTYHLPGNREFQVSYSLVDKKADAALAKEEFGSVCIEYFGASDKNTLMNLTNHVYFNLNGHGVSPLPSITNHKLKLSASHFTPIDAHMIPTGELRPVQGTPFDFEKLRTIGEDIEADDEQLGIAGGYDHNYVIDGAKGETFSGDGHLRPCAVLYEEGSGRHMYAETTLPGVQLYSGNFMQKQTGKSGRIYERRGGLCLETQYFPSAINVEAFEQCGYPKPIFGPDRHYKETTVYTFGRIKK